MLRAELLTGEDAFVSLAALWILNDSVHVQETSL